MPQDRRAGRWATSDTLDSAMRNEAANALGSLLLALAILLAWLLLLNSCHGPLIGQSEFLGGEFY